MRIIIGKLLRIFFLYITQLSSAQASLELSVKDIEGRPLTKAAVGIPFLVELALKDCGNQSVTLPGLEHFDIVGKKSYCTVINNTMTARQVYTVCSHAEGTFTLGPASIPWENRRIETPALTIGIGTEQEYHAQQKIRTHKSKKAEPQVFLVAESSQLYAVIGEKIGITITLYTNKDNIIAHHPVTMPPKGGSLGALTHKSQGIKEYNNSEHHFVEWQTSYTPTQEGSHVIPAYAVDYEEQRAPSASPWPQLFSLWSTQAQNHRIYSNALKITVDPLPLYDKPINAVGIFTNFSAHVTTHSAQCGDAIQWSLQIEGNGNIDTATLDPQIPSPFRLYFSGDTIKESPHNNRLLLKNWNYILQGLTEGDWEIPCQTFVYYNTETRTLCELHTTPITVSITPSSTQKSSSTNADISSKIALDESGNQQPFDTTSLWDNRYKNTYGTYQVPWSLWFFLMMLPFLFLFWTFGHAKIYSCFRLTKHLCRKRYAFLLARYSIKQAMKKGDYRALYPILVQLFSDRCGYSPALISCQDMHNIVTQDTVTQTSTGNLLTSRNDHSLYLSRCIEIFFTDRILAPDEQHQFFQEAQQLIAHLEKYL